MDIGYIDVGCDNSGVEGIHVGKVEYNTV